MKHNWEYRALKNVTNILYGYPFDSNGFNADGKGIPLIRIRDVKPGFTSTFYEGSYPKEYIISNGDYLVGMDGEFNIAPWKGDDALLNQRVCKIHSIDEKIVLSKFIFYFLGKELKKIEERTPFVTVKHLSAKVLNAITLPVPPMEVQEQIVAELDKINETIENCRELLRTLDSLATSLFYETFGDPVSNPKGWKVKNFSTLFSLKSGEGLSAKNFINGSYPVYGGNGITGYHSEYNKNGEYIIIGRVGAKCGNVRYVKGKFWLTDNAFELTQKNELFNPIFLTILLSSLNLGVKAKMMAQPVISNIALKDVMVYVPPLALQEQFAAQVEAIEVQKKAVEETIASLQTLLDSRMDYWFN